MNFKDKTALVYDLGLGIDHASRLGRDFKKVLLYTPWQTAMPSFVNYSIGLGIENVEKVYHFFNHVDEADVICFFDTGNGDLASYLRKSGKVVYGAGEAEVLEEERYRMRKVQKAIGLPTQSTDVVQGITKLRSTLKRQGDRYVKLDRFRGDIESFYAKDYESVEMILDEIEASFGPFKEEYQFMVEEGIEGDFEPGFDCFFNGDKWLKPYLWGFEKGEPYLGVFTDTLPPILADIQKKLVPVLKKLDHRGAFSSEALIKGDIGYFIDATPRYPFPLSLIFTEAIKNYSEIIWSCATRKDAYIQKSHKYVGCLPLNTPHAKDYWVRLHFDEKLRNKIKLHLSCKSGNHYYTIRGITNGVCLIGMGDSSEKVADDLIKLTGEVDAFELDKSGDCLYKILEDIQKAKDAGWKW